MAEFSNMSAGLKTIIMMRIKQLLILPLFLFGVTCLAQKTDKPMHDEKAHDHKAHDQGKGHMKDTTMTVVTMEDMKWMPGPKTLPAGTQMMVLSGDPSKAGMFTIRIKFAAGTKVMPHWHSADENVTVLKGTMKLGMGDNFDEASMKTNTAGTYLKMPAKMHHYAMAVDESIIQLHGMGPFNVVYINPKDDPSKNGTMK
jgi:quercetin dioxygenase-like cupin family protein